MRSWILGLLAGLSAMGATEEAGKFVGLLDIRPTWTTQSGSLGTENTVQAGYQFNADRKLYYTQYINTNLDSSSTATTGLNPELDLGYLGFKMSNIVKTETSGLSVNFEPRAYLPTSSSAQADGMIVVNRNYLTVKQKVSDTLTLTAVELPILQVYSRAGTVLESGAKANPAFENRVYLIADVQISEKISLSVPLMFYQTKYSNFQEGAKNNAAWTFSLYTWPEITYSLTDAASVGLAYYNNLSFVKSDLSGFQIGDALESGAVQAAFTYVM